MEQFGIGQSVRRTEDPPLPTGHGLHIDDIAPPRAADMPTIRFATETMRYEADPMGAKGAGEAGAIGAPPAVVDAVTDALADPGVRHFDMPASPARIRRTIRAAEASR
jgi:carbon-monoxide dehydrogenase large subunit